MNVRQEDIDEFISKFESSNSSTSTSGERNWGKHCKELLAEKRKEKKRSTIKVDSTSVRNKKSKADQMSLKRFVMDFDSSVEYISGRLPPTLTNTSKNTQDLIMVENFLPDQVALDLFSLLDTLAEDEWEHSSSEVDAKMHRYHSSNAGSTAHSFSATGGLLIDSSTIVDQYKSDASTDLDKVMCILSSGFQSKRTDVLACTKYTFQCGRYTKGNYIEPHDDTGTEEIDNEVYMRDVAIILYLSRSWRFDMGGLFVDLASHPAFPLVPKFNTLICFKVPRLHQVTPIEDSTVKRYSLFGWTLIKIARRQPPPLPTIHSRSKKKRKRNKDKRKDAEKLDCH